MKTPWRNLGGTGKLIAICVAVFLVAGGLCGIQWAVVGRTHIPNSIENILIAIGLIELALMVLSAAVMVVTSVVFLGAESVKSISRRSGRAQKPYDDSEDGSPPAS